MDGLPDQRELLHVGNGAEFDVTGRVFVGAPNASVICRYRYRGNTGLVKNIDREDPTDQSHAGPSPLDEAEYKFNLSQLCEP